MSRRTRRVPHGTAPVSSLDTASGACNRFPLDCGDRARGGVFIAHRVCNWCSLVLINVQG
eukprot:4211164-Prymnesium_polylepis.1